MINDPVSSGRQGLKTHSGVTNDPAPAAQVNYLTADHLGSPRVVTNQNGEVIKRTHWMAFGEEAFRFWILDFGLLGFADNKSARAVMIAVFSSGRGALFDNYYSSNGTTIVYTNPGTGYLNVTLRSLRTSLD